MLAQNAFDERLVGLRRRCREGKRDLAKAEFEQAIAAAGLAVVVTLGRRPGENLDLAVIETEAAIDLGDLRLDRPLVRQEETSRTALDDGPLRIRRVPGLCIDCAKCAKACPSILPVDRLVTIQSAECLGCMQCVAVCPEDGALFLSAPRQKRVPAWAVAAGVAVLFFGAYAAARATGHWDTNLPDRVYQHLVPRADEYAHP